MGTSLGVSDTMALISSKLSNIVPFSCCALFLYTEETETLRCRFATGVEAEIVQQLTVRTARGSPAGSRAIAGRSSTHARARISRPAGMPTRRHCSRRSSARWSSTSVSSARWRFTTSTPAVYTEDHRRLLDRVSEQAAAVIYNSIVFEQTQEDSLTDPLTGAAEHALHVHAPHARAGAAEPAEVGSVAAGDGPGQLQGNQRHLRAPRRRPRAARSRRRAARRNPALRHLRPLCGRRVHRRALGMRRGRGRAEAARAADGRRRPASSKRGPARCCRSRISIGAAVFPHDGDSYETLLATADSRMYRDKTRRKKQGGSGGGGDSSPSRSSSRPGALTQSDVQRAAVGVL